MTDPYDPVVAKKNRKLGLVLAGVVALVVTAFMIRYAVAGLPPDRKEWNRQQQAASAELSVSTPQSVPENETP